MPSREILIPNCYDFCYNFGKVISNGERELIMESIGQTIDSASINTIFFIFRFPIKSFLSTQRICFTSNFHCFYMGPLTESSGELMRANSTNKMQNNCWDEYKLRSFWKQLFNNKEDVMKLDLLFKKIFSEKIIDTKS